MNLATLSDKSFNTLRWLNLGLGVAHTAAASTLLGLILSSDGIETGFFSLISNPNPAPSEFLYKLKASSSLRLDWLVFGFFAVTAAAHFLYASNVGDFYRKALLEGGNSYRWIEYAISSTLMIIVVASLSGIRDVRSLGLIASANVAIMIQGFVLERMLAKDSDTVDFVVPFATSWGLLSIIWIAIIISFAKRINEAKAAGYEVPDFVYGTIIPTFIFFTSFGVVNLIQIIKERKKKGSPKSIAPYEMSYTLLSLFSKLLLGIFIVVGISRSQTLGSL